MLSAVNVSKAYGSRILFDELNLTVAAGECIALIGANGSGKTTLLDILAGDISPDTGGVSKKRNVTIGYLKQENAGGSSKTLIEDVLEESPEVTTLRDRIAAIHESLSLQTNPDNHEELMRQLRQLQSALEAADVSYREHEAKAILSGLGFKQDDFHRPLGEFSGGWLMRAVLGKLLFMKPDVLLLDEPTNHLDLNANLWFEEVPVLIPRSDSRHLPRPDFLEPGSNHGAGSSGPHHQDSGEAKIRESTAGVSRKPSSDGKARGSSSKHLCGLTAWNT